MSVVALRVHRPGPVVLVLLLAALAAASCSGSSTAIGDAASVPTGDEPADSTQPQEGADAGAQATDQETDSDASDGDRGDNGPTRPG